VRKTLPAMLRCPLCEADISIQDIYEDTPEALIHGSLQCECDTYPVCYGVLILKNSPVKKYVLHFLKERAFKQAALFAMANYADDICRLLNFVESFKVGKLFRTGIFRIITAYLNTRYRKYFDDNTSFMELLGDGAYDQYLRHRFSSQTFWSLYPFISLIRSKGGRILEVCCGSGHASFILSRSIPPEKLIGIDGDFRNLYLAEKYFSRADFIQADMNAGLPFKDHQFSVAFMMDSLHYVDARALLAKELIRVTTPEGFNLILHLHNALKENVLAGRPLSPAAIRRIFRDDEILLLPEKEVIENFIQNGRLDMSGKYTENQIREADAVVVARHAPSAIVEGLWDDLLFPDDHLIVNPMYRTEDRDDHILLTRIFPSDAFRREYPLTEAYLPDRYEIKKAVLREGRDLLSEEFREMRRKYILISVPGCYGGKDPFDLI
jgi:ubiquinone/menaquinone biosynthesis C-methylase UbiE